MVNVQHSRASQDMHVHAIMPPWTAMFWAGDDAKNRREQITFDRVADVISTPVNSATSSCASRLPPPLPPHRRVRLLSDARLLLLPLVLMPIHLLLMLFFLLFLL